ncbi:hypothetical protein HWV23_13870 [Natronomonas halophila]|uniref:hypothetical protein n=1 Tax=Natronomonas halophila TaxID=2747817 RepID=UPI0015B616CF|nr:hypothetical protein [Natronomonas halophila]QLD86769.1 hypothetical protein HWV23_13870 [Natronomonas halophila]
MISPHFRTRAVLVVGLVAVCLLAAAGLALADDHTRETAPYYEHGNESANATVVFLDQEDHYPGAEEGSVRYTVRGDEAFADVGASDGFNASWFIVDAPFVDHSGCDIENVDTFGVDRDADGTVEEDLIEASVGTTFEDGRITVRFYEESDFGGDPVHIYPGDRIILEIGDESAGGPCTRTTEEMGWYTADLFLNGSASAGDGAQYGFTVESNETYVCECDSREEAEEELGPDPAPSTATPTAATETATPTKTATPTPTETPTDTPTVTDTATPPEKNLTADLTITPLGEIETANGTDNPIGAAGADPTPESPTPEDGVGFGGFAAVVSLLASVVLWHQRR